MGVERNALAVVALEFGIENFTRLLDRLVDGLRGRGAGGVLEREAVEGHPAGENLLQAVDVEFRRVRIRFVEVRGEAHHGDGRLVLEAVLRDVLAGGGQVAHVVQSVEVADGGDAVLLEEFRVQFDDVARLRGEADHIDAAGEGLEIHVRADHFAAAVHHFERIFLAVEIEALEAGSAADFDIIDPGLDRRIERGQEIIGLDTGAEAGLEAVTERAIHELDFLHLLTILRYD